jgi:hypothetical protein
VKSLLHYMCGFILVATHVAEAQTVVAGQVVNRSTRVPLPRVLVELLNPADSVLGTSTSGADGTFTLEARAAGTYRVRLTAPESDSYVSDTLTVALGDYFAREFPINPSPKAFLEFQVDRPVLPVKNQRGPRYPDDLRQSHISGCALVQFVVDENGMADTTTLRALRFSQIEFVHAVRDWLRTARFVPAELGGRKVRQLVHQPFNFDIIGEQRRVEIPGNTTRGPAGGVQPVIPPPRMTVPPPPPSSKPAMCR